MCVYWRERGWGLLSMLRGSCTRFSCCLVGVGQREGTFDRGISIHGYCFVTFFVQNTFVVVLVTLFVVLLVMFLLFFSRHGTVN